MDRRKFVAAIVSGGVVSSLAKEKSISGNIDSDYDVVVVGGGVSGIIAALQSGRSGLNTLIVESSSQLGGTMTTAGINSPGLFHAWGNQVIAGIGWELVSKTVQAHGDKFPDFSKFDNPAFWELQVTLNEYLYSCLAEEEILKTGIHILYYMSPESVEECGGGYKLSIVGKSSRKSVFAKRVIDCTGNAAVVDMAGFRRLRGNVIQPGTLDFEFENFDASKITREEFFIAKKNAIKNGELLRSDIYGDLYRLVSFKGRNCEHLADADSSNAQIQTSSNIRGRESFLRIFRFLKKLKGFENVRIKNVKTEVGVRESFRIDALHNITVDEYVSAKRYPDGVCYSFYHIDLHDDKGARARRLKKGVVPCVPLSALIPKSSKFMIAAGRHVGSDRLANSALRIQASCMAMGQAAGAACAVSIRNSCPISEVDINQVRTILSENGAILPPLRK